MKTKTALAYAWMRKGDSDFTNAGRTVASEGPYDTACFHAQQAAEKYLKAILALHGEPIPRTHDLEELQDACATLRPDPDLEALDLAGLTGYAVELRYDADFWPDKGTACEALDLARQVRAAAARLLPAMPSPESGT